MDRKNSLRNYSIYFQRIFLLNCYFPYVTYVSCHRPGFSSFLAQGCSGHHWVRCAWMIFMALGSEINYLKCLGTSNLIHFLKIPKVQRSKAITLHFQVGTFGSLAPDSINSCINLAAVLTTTHQMAAGLRAITKKDWKFCRDPSGQNCLQLRTTDRKYSTKS